MISDSAHSYQLGYEKGKQEEREKVLSEVEKWASENEKFWDNSVYVSQLKDKLNQLKEA